MAFRDLKVTVVKGDCSRTRLGSSFYVRNGRLEVPPGESVCLFSLGSLLPALTGAMMETTPGEGMLDLSRDWRCPDPQAGVVYRIEPA